MKIAPHYRKLGIEPRELVRRADAMLTEIGEKFGTIPGTNHPYFRFDDPRKPGYERKLDLLFPLSGDEQKLGPRVVQGLIHGGSRLLPS